MDHVFLGEYLTFEQFMTIVKDHKQVKFSEIYSDRVNKSRHQIEQWVDENRVMYGITTGFGSLCEVVISKDETAKLQKNLILSHATSVGSPLSIEEVRAVMLMVLQNIGQGYSGVRLEVLERYRDMLNHNIIPYVPSEGSVGYLAIEAHIALTLFGDGKVFYNGQLLNVSEVYSLLGWDPIVLAAKEGLALISGTTSVTGLGSVALYNLFQAAKTADIIASITSEALICNLSAFDEKVMKVRPHKDQQDVAHNLRAILNDSPWLVGNHPRMLQDALSIRCIPQLHGAVRKILNDAKATIEVEINSCCDNPIIYMDDDGADVISACNADSSYVGMAMDSVAIAATNMAKMSERRNNRLIDESYSGYPSFLIQHPGVNSGLMIPQYTQAALLNDMRMLSTSSTIDNTPTCNNQEDYVGMGYNASKKSLKIAENLEYILAIELLSGYLAQKFMEGAERNQVTRLVVNILSKHLPHMDSDVFLSPCIETIKSLIHSGEILTSVEQVIGELR